MDHTILADPSAPSARTQHEEDLFDAHSLDSALPGTYGIGMNIYIYIYIIIYIYIYVHVP